jgi:F0F1-type ATP synthase membrane subunit b/b'
MRAALRAEVAQVQQELAELERIHLADVESVRDAGRQEAARIIAEARAEVARRRHDFDPERNHVG